jgi:hypothetical protein
MSAVEVDTIRSTTIAMARGIGRFTENPQLPAFDGVVGIKLYCTMLKKAHRQSAAHSFRGVILVGKGYGNLSVPE